MTSSSDKPTALADRIDAIEDAYEFMLAFAAQGRAGDETSGPTSNVRELLEKAEAALDGLAAEFSSSVSGAKGNSTKQYKVFLDVLEQDSQKARAAIGLVLSQSKLSSQLIDNLNASSHVRTILTDVFLIDEIVKSAGSS